MSYKAYIFRIRFINNHPNADRLNLTAIYGNQIIIGLDTKKDDIGIFFPTDGQLSEAYCIANDLIAYKDPKTGEKKGGYFSDKRRVRAQAFRGEKSEGFFMPLESLAFTGYDLSKLKDGDQIDKLNGFEICTKYITSATKSARRQGQNKRKQCKMFRMHVETKQFDYEINKIFDKQKGGLVTITEKLHGTSGRTGCLKVMSPIPFWGRILKKIFNRRLIEFFDWSYVTGSRRVIVKGLEDVKNVGEGYYNSDNFRLMWHDKLKDNLFKGETVYYEIVGYVTENKPIMNICQNKKLKDKAFIKQYGDETIFKYGCMPGQCDIYVYRMTMTNEDGNTVEYPWYMMAERCEQLDLKTVPLLCDPFILSHVTKEELIKIVEDLCDGPSTIDQTHIREGNVLRIDKRNDCVVFKKKNFNFKVIEGIIKESNVIDIEEAEDYVEVVESI